MDALINKLPPLPLELKKELLELGKVMDIPNETEVLREGQYVKAVPLVLEGTIKVFSSHEDRDLLLYYIEPSESCIMSFSAGLWNLPSRVKAITEADSKVLLIPNEVLASLLHKYPAFEELFFKQYNQRYDDLLDTINQVLFEKMDKRILDYLKDKSNVLGEKVLNIRHHQIAREIGSAREVVSRVLKKLEKEGLLRQKPEGIEIL